MNHEEHLMLAWLAVFIIACLGVYCTPSTHKRRIKRYRKISGRYAKRTKPINFFNK